MKTLLLNAGYLIDDLTQIWSKPGYGGITYSDGDAVETRIADIIAQAEDLTVLSSELPQYCTDWPTLYHLSNHRANILRPFEQILAGAEILEIGAGCGAITRYLGECGARTLALEGSPRRAAIARSRVRDLSNVEVLAERFDDFACDHKFDIVTLIGVLEYANLFSAGEEPAKAMLQHVHGLLKPGGKAIIAIENQFGLKYFAGAAEDHLGQPMVGIEDRYRRDQPRTWGRVQLESMLKNSGFRHCEFMAPFPDYKLPKSIVTEAGFRANDFDASAFAWQSVRTDPQLPSLLNFSPELAWPGLFDNKLGLDLANSFLVVGSIQEFDDTAENVLAWHYTTGRRASFCKETRFARCQEGRIGVFLRRLGKDEMQTGDAPLVFVPQEESDYVLGTPLSREFVRIVTRDGWTMEEVAAWFRRYLAMVDAYVESRTGRSSAETATLPGFCFDLIPSNIICLPDGSYQVIDQEWERRDEIPREYFVFRSVSNLINLVTRFGRIATDELITRSYFMTELWRLLEFNEDASSLERWIDKEMRIQEFVIGHPLVSDWLSIFLNDPLNDLDKDAQIANLNQEHHTQIANLVQTHAIKKSRSWRLTRPLRRVTAYIRDNPPLKRLLQLFGLRKNSNIAAQYWNSQFAEGPVTSSWVWWQSPEIANYLGELVCGEPIDHIANLSVKAILKHCAGTLPFEHAISIGCGNAYKEIALLKNGIVNHFSLYDISQEAISQARTSAEQAGFADSTTLSTADPFQCEHGSFDMVYWDNSLHHMMDVHAAIAWSYEHLKPGGTLIMNDFVGPSRFQWNEKMLTACNAILEDFNVPPVYRPDPSLLEKINPSEAADSSNIKDALFHYFPEALWIPMGGVMYFVGLTFRVAELSQDFLMKMVNLDAALNAAGEYVYAFAVAKKR